jgi:hypothetical protein
MKGALFTAAIKTETVLSFSTEGATTDLLMKGVPMARDTKTHPAQGKQEQYRTEIRIYQHDAAGFHRAKSLRIC